MTRRLRILHIINSFETGGLEKLLFYFLKGVVNQNIAHGVVALEDIGPLKKDFQLLNIQVFGMNKRAGSDPLLLKSLLQLVKDERPDIIHTHDLGAHFYGSICSLVGKIPFKIHTQHCIPPKFNWKDKLKHRFLDRKSDILICVSNDIKKFIENYWNPRCHMQTIYNGISVQLCEREEVKQTKTSLGLQEGSSVVGHVGRLAKIKDQATLIEAFAVVLEKIPSAYLIIVGDGPLRNELKTLVDQLNINKNVVFLGQRDDVWQILNCFDVFALSSLSEGLSIALLEAMSLSLPVIATCVGGNPEIIQDNQNGLLVPPSDSGKLANAIIGILTDHDKSTILGEAAGRTVAEKFSMHGMRNAYNQIYESCLQTLMKNS